MVTRDFDQYLFFYEFLNAFTGIIGEKIDRERVNGCKSIFLTYQCKNYS